jgi:MoaA/NifB/PqqE/SkfB family radical SAM enzyme
VQTSEIFQAWGKILRGQQPALSIEITRECPLRCPGCYAFDAAHLGGGQTLRNLIDRKGQALIDGVLEVVDREKPLHLSIVGGDPLVRYRELEALVPKLLSRGMHVQIVTSAFRKMDPSWARLSRLHVVVSIDGLQPEHDVRRAPATYDRILKNIAVQSVTIHCTITAQMMKRPGYLAEFLEFWTPRPEIKKVWFSMFTPQVGDQLAEILSPTERAQAIAEMIQLRRQYPKLDMPHAVIQQFAAPPHSPSDCVFALTTQTISADLETKITPCQFGGTPDCAQCGCIASIGLASVAAHKLGGFLPVGAIFKASIKIGKMRAGLSANSSPRPKAPLSPNRETRPASVLGHRSEVAFTNSVLESLPVLQPAQDNCANQETELTS